MRRSGHASCEQPGRHVQPRRAVEAGSDARRRLGGHVGGRHSDRHDGKPLGRVGALNPLQVRRVFIGTDGGAPGSRELGVRPLLAGDGNHAGLLRRQAVHRLPQVEVAIHDGTEPVALPVAQRGQRVVDQRGLARHGLGDRGVVLDLGPVAHHAVYGARGLGQPLMVGHE